MPNMEWRWPNFTPDELRCPCCGAIEMNSAFMDRLQTLRNEYGKVMAISSGYRCPEHNRKVGGVENSAHVQGKAVDVATRDGWGLVRVAYLKGFTGIGVSQKGASRFIHLDDDVGLHRPAMWSY